MDRWPRRDSSDFRQLVVRTAFSFSRRSSNKIFSRKHFVEIRRPKKRKPAFVPRNKQMFDRRFSSSWLKAAKNIWSTITQRRCREKKHFSGRKVESNVSDGDDAWNDWRKTSPIDKSIKQRTTRRTSIWIPKRTFTSTDRRSLFSLFRIDSMFRINRFPSVLVYRRIVSSNDFNGALWLHSDRSKQLGPSGSSLFSDSAIVSTRQSLSGSTQDKTTVSKKYDNQTNQFILSLFFFPKDVRFDRLVIEKLCGSEENWIFNATLWRFDNHVERSAWKWNSICADRLNTRREIVDLTVWRERTDWDREEFVRLIQTSNRKISQSPTEIGVMNLLPFHVNFRFSPSKALRKGNSYLRKLFLSKTNRRDFLLDATRRKVESLLRKIRSNGRMT